LQELLQSRKQPLPVYELLAVEGEAHDQTFHVSCKVEGEAQAVEGSGSSRRKAEQDAARRAYEMITGQ
jgi:ribonuclease-3